MKAEHVVAAIRAAMEGRREDMLSVVRQMEANASASGKIAVAKQIRSLLNSRSAQMIALPSNVPGCVSIQPARSLDTLMLESSLRTSLFRIVEERSRRDVLFEHGLSPRSKFLFYGPPGNGKTAAAEGLALAMGLPLLVADYSELIDSHMGETEKGLRRAFDAAEAAPCILFLDECDTLLSERGGDAPAARAYSGATNYILTRMDRLPNSVVFIAATNRSDILDSACKRRFDSVLEFGSPTQSDLDALRQELTRRFPVLASEDDLPKAAESYAEYELMLIDIAREAVLRMSRGEEAA